MIHPVPGRDTTDPRISAFDSTTAKLEVRRLANLVDTPPESNVAPPPAPEIPLVELSSNDPTGPVRDRLG